MSPRRRGIGLGYGPMSRVLRLVAAGFLLGLLSATAHAASDGDLRIEDGPSGSRSHGRLEVFHEGEWGGVCDDFFGAQEATVACRQLGYTEGEAKRREKRPLPSTMSFWLDNVDCAGTESGLGRCEHNGWGEHNCSAREAVSISCTGSVQTSPPASTPEPASGLAASNATQTTLALAWTLPAQASGVTVSAVEVQRQSGTTWDTVATLAAEATSHTVTGLSPGTHYTFRVQITTSNGSADSDTVSVTTLAAPEAATGLTASNATQTTIDLAWTLPAQGAGVTVSAVRVQQQSGAAWSTVATLDADAPPRRGRRADDDALVRSGAAQRRRRRRDRLRADVGGGLRLADTARGLSLDLKARGLVAHEADGFRERGASASFAFDPRPSSDRGFSVSLRQSWGASSSGGMDAFLGRETLAGLAAGNNRAGAKAASRLEAELGYGLPVFGGVFTGTPHAGVALTGVGREYRLGWRLTAARRDALGFALDLEGTRGESAGGDESPEHVMMLRGSMRW